MGIYIRACIYQVYFIIWTRQRGALCVSIFRSQYIAARARAHVHAHFYVICSVYKQARAASAVLPPGVAGDQWNEPKSCARHRIIYTAQCGDIGGYIRAAIAHSCRALRSRLKAILVQ